MTIGYSPGVSGYGCSLSGLPANTPCTITVLAISASNLLMSPSASFSMTYQATLLSGVDLLESIPTA